MADAVKQFLGKFNIGEVISFQVYPSDLYGSNWNRMLVTDVISARSTALFNFDAAVEHAKVQSDANVPVGQVPQSYDSYQYLVVAPPADPNSFRLIGLPWIIVDSIVVETTRDAVGYFPDMSDATMEELRKAISSVISNFKLDWQKQQ